MSLHTKCRYLALGLVLAHAPAVVAHHEVASAGTGQGVLLVGVLSVLAFSVWRLRDRS